MEVLLNWARDGYTQYGPKVLTGLATLIVGLVLAKVLKIVMHRILIGTRVERTLAGFLTSLAYVALLVLVVITALDRFGFPAISFAAVIGAAGLAIGLALKGTLSDFAAGVVLIGLRPFKVGDTIDAAGVTGVVSNIQVFATFLETPENKRIIVPNSKITGGTIVNHSAV